MYGGNEMNNDNIVLKEMQEEMKTLRRKLLLLSNNFYDRDGTWSIYEGNFEITLIGGDIVHTQAIGLNDPPYRLGDFAQYFHFRTDKLKEINKPKWGDFEWYTSSPECFMKLKNGKRTLTRKIYKDRTEYILETAEDIICDLEFVRCPLRFDIMGIIFRCDLRDGHSGQCISLPDEPRKIATVMWPKGEGF